jgi:iron complex outermembrane receptor protein/vitamin B12 transporter
VTGTVTDPSGAAVPGAVVEAVVGGGVVGSVTTGNDGRYTLTVPGGASRELRVSREGFSTEAFGIAAGGQTSRNVALRIAPVESAIVVTPSRTEQALAEVSAPVSLFTAPDIARSGSRQLGDVLGRVPGLSVEATGREGAMASLFSRGGESDYNLVLLDGVRVNDNGGQFDFSRISASEIESVEIVRGAKSALYGSNAIGAVVNVTTRHADPDDAPFLAVTL